MYDQNPSQTGKQFIYSQKKSKYSLYISIILTIMLLGAAIFLAYKYYSQSKSNRSVPIESLDTISSTGDLGSASQNDADTDPMETGAIPQQAELITTKPLIYHQNISIPGLTTLTPSFNLFNYDQITFTLSLPPHIGHSIINPSQQILDFINPRTSLAKEQFRSYTKINPQSGEWQIELINRSATPSSAIIQIESKQYAKHIDTYVLVNQQDNTLSIYVDLTSQSLQNSPNISLSLENQFGSSKTYSLADQAESGDLLAGDNIYSIETPKLESGRYLLFIRIQTSELRQVRHENITITH